MAMVVAEVVAVVMAVGLFIIYYVELHLSEDPLLPLWMPRPRGQRLVLYLCL